MKSQTERVEDVARFFDEVRPRVLPVPWVEVPGQGFRNAQWYERQGPLDFWLRACLEVEAVRARHEQRYELWMHLSLSAKGRTPFWVELRDAKRIFLGDRRAVQVLPPEAEYVNIHPHVLHLYAPIERDPMPDFRFVNELGITAL